jgi:hypothetical protein
VQPIPAPHLLDPERLLDPQRDDFTADHESRAEMYRDGLRESCEYAQQLWQTLDTVRGYLMDSLPPDPREPGEHISCASPTGPDDEAGWTNWVAAFASVTSVLCGPHGDSGFGYGEARRAADLRRDAPVIRVRAAVHDLPPAGAESTPPPDPEPTSANSAPRSVGRVRMVVTGLLVLLAARGLLPRRVRAGGGCESNGKNG